eukprot:5487228-Prymnesium_polylepis.1
MGIMGRRAPLLGVVSAASPVRLASLRTATGGGTRDVANPTARTPRTELHGAFEHAKRCPGLGLERSRTPHVVEG